MPSTTFTIGNQAWTDMKEMVWHRVPMICDPEWVDPEDGSECPKVPEFTKAQWGIEHWRREMKAYLNLYRQRELDKSKTIGTVDDTEIEVT